MIDCGTSILWRLWRCRRARILVASLHARFPEIFLTLFTICAVRALLRIPGLLGDD